MTALRKSEIVSFCNQYLYDYRIRESSIAHSIKPQYLLDNILAMDEVHHICTQAFPEEMPFCRRRLSALLYEFLAAKAYGQQVAEQNPGILEHALQTVGGEAQLSAQMETPLGTIFYTYNQFYPYLTKEEKRKLQRDYRKCFCKKNLKDYSGPFWIKHLISYLSLGLMRKVLIAKSKS